MSSTTKRTAVALGNRHHQRNNRQGKNNGGAITWETIPIRPPCTILKPRFQPKISTWPKPRSNPDVHCRNNNTIPELPMYSAVQITRIYIKSPTNVSQYSSSHPRCGQFCVWRKPSWTALRRLLLALLTWGGYRPPRTPCHRRRKTTARSSRRVPPDERNMKKNEKKNIQPYYRGRRSIHHNSTGSTHKKQYMVCTTL